MSVEVTGHQSEAAWRVEAPPLRPAVTPAPIAAKPEPLPGSESELIRLVAVHRALEAEAIQRFGTGSREAFAHHLKISGLPTAFWDARRQDHIKDHPAIAVFATPESDQVSVLHHSTSPDNPNGWRITHFSRSYGGPTGHTEGKTPEELVGGVGWRRVLGHLDRPIPAEEADRLLRDLLNGRWKIGGGA